MEFDADSGHLKECFQTGFWSIRRRFYLASQSRRDSRAFFMPRLTKLIVLKVSDDCTFLKRSVLS